MSEIKQSVIRAERKNGIIKQKGVVNSNLTYEVDDFCASSLIERDTEGICVFQSNGEKEDGIFIPLSKQKSLIELMDALKSLQVSSPVVIVPPIPPEILPDPNQVALQEIKTNLNLVVSKIILLLREVI